MRRRVVARENVARDGTAAPSLFRHLLPFRSGDDDHVKRAYSSLEHALRRLRLSLSTLSGAGWLIANSPLNSRSAMRPLSYERIRNYRPFRTRFYRPFSQVRHDVIYCQSQFFSCAITISLSACFKSSPREKCCNYDRLFCISIRALHKFHAQRAKGFPRQYRRSCRRRLRE